MRVYCICDGALFYEKYKGSRPSIGRKPQKFHSKTAHAIR